MSAARRRLAFTHLAPVSATFHPLMAELADADRLRGLPIHIVTGGWTGCFSAGGAARHNRRCRPRRQVTYRELDDLSHAYPREMNASI